MRTSQWLSKNWWRVLVSVAFDVYDFTIGRLPILGTFTDLAAGFLSLWLWGAKNPSSYIQFLEVADVTDQIDAQLPSLTISAIVRWYNDTR